MYENICNVYYNEMDLWFKSHNVNNVAMDKCFDIVPNCFGMRNCFTYGEKLCEAEANYLSSQQNSRARRALLVSLKQEQNTFDKSYRRTKCKSEHDKLINIEGLNTENPREF